MKIWGTFAEMDMRVLDQENRNGIFRLNLIDKIAPARCLAVRVVAWAASCGSNSIVS